MKIKIGSAVSAFFLLSSNVFATAYHLPSPNDSLIGSIQQLSAGSGDSVITIQQKYDIGYNAVENANPQLNLRRGFQKGEMIEIPTQHLLPNAARKGIVINLPEMRLYYFPEGSHQVFTYPIGIGKIGKTIPITDTYITKKTVNPTWTPPEDIREFNLQQGIVLPQVMPPGPDNPLGPYAIYMKIPTYLIHSTIFPESVGTRASFGCIRMYESDIKSFFPSIEKGIPVIISNSPVKVGWEENRLFAEVHPGLEEHGDAYENSLPGMVHTITQQSISQPTLVDWQMVSYLVEERDGLPHEVGVKIHH